MECNLIVIFIKTKLMINFFKYITFTFLVFAFFLQCSSVQKLQDSVSFKIEQPYYQNWVAGVKNGGSGINIFIPVTNLKTNIALDSLYFRGHKVLLETKPNNPNLFIGRILTEANQNEDFSPKTEAEIPFDLKENEAVIIYTENDKKKYYKIDNIKEKQTEYFPSAPPKQN